MTLKCAGFVVLVCLLGAPALLAQKRRLGPADRTRILDARLDPAFATAGLKRLALLPFSNELDYPEGAMVLGENFLGQMRQKHEEVETIAPAAVMQILRQANLADSYRAFIGNYLNTEVATTAFLQQFGRAANVDGVVIGRVIAYSVLTTSKDLNTQLGTVTLPRNRAVVGMRLLVFRASDGRQLWSGLHAVEGQKDQNVVELAKIVGDVFAQYYGRLPY